MKESTLYRFRQPDWPVHPLFWRRWSPRAMSGEEISHDELMALFEAARWAPSAYNSQPWRFLYARRGTTHWDAFFGLLSESNRSWCRNAAVLIAVLSNPPDGDDVSARTRSFDAGAAWMSLALEGSILGLVVHALRGFDESRARTVLAVPTNCAIEAMIAVGHPGRTEDLSEEKRRMEFPKGRKIIWEFISEGPFPG